MRKTLTLAAAIGIALLAGCNGDLDSSPASVASQSRPTSIGGPSNVEEFTQWQWMTVKGEAPAYPI